MHTSPAIQKENKIGRFQEHVVRMAIATLILVATTEVRFYLPFSPIPLSLHPLTVFLIGAAFGGRRAMISAAPFLLFKMFPGAPNAGYFAGMLLAAGFVGWSSERKWTHSYAWTLLALFIADALVLSCGALWLATMVGPVRSVSLGVIPFLGGDLCKILLAATLIPTISRFAVPWRGSST